MGRRVRLTDRKKYASRCKGSIDAQIEEVERMFEAQDTNGLEAEAEAIDKEPANAELTDEAEELAKEEADIVEEGLNVDVGDVSEPMDYTDQNTKMSSDDSALAAQLVHLAKKLLES